MNNYQKAISRYNQIMGYRTSHTPGHFTKEELEEQRAKNEKLFAYYRRLAEGKKNEEN